MHTRRSRIAEVVIADRIARAARSRQERIRIEHVIGTSRVSRAWLVSFRRRLTSAHPITQIDRMMRAAICLSAVLVLGFPTFSHAQYNDNDRQNSKEYSDEDSQPLAIIADVFYPIGFAAEWLIARPLHYVATDSPMAPVFRPIGGADDTPPPPVPVIPDNSLTVTTSSSSAAQDWTPNRVPVSAAQTGITASPVTPPVSAYSRPPARQSQSQMH